MFNAVASFNAVTSFNAVASLRSLRKRVVTPLSALKTLSNPVTKAATWAVFMLAAVVALSGVGTPALAAAPSPGPNASLAVRAKAAQVPLLDEEAFVTHTHTLVRVVVNGETVPVPADIGILAKGPKIAALHTHDGSGIVHVESPTRGDVYRLDQFFTLWGMGKDRGELCRRLAEAPRCTIKVTSQRRAAHGLRTRLVDQDSLNVELSTSTTVGSAAL